MDIQEYRTGDLARALQVNPNTVRAWADTYADLLSERATAAKRSYAADDALLLATVAEMRDQGLSFDAIREALQSGQRIEQMPAIPSRQEVEAKQQEGIVLQSEYEGLLAQFEQEREYRQHLEEQLTVVTARRDDLQQRLESETSAIRVQWRAEVDGLNQRIIELESELGQARGKLSVIEQERLPAWQWLAIVVLIALAAITVTAGVVLAVAGG